MTTLTPAYHAVSQILVAHLQWWLTYLSWDRNHIALMIIVSQGLAAKSLIIYHIHQDSICALSYIRLASPGSSGRLMK